MRVHDDPEVRIDLELAKAGMLDPKPIIAGGPLMRGDPVALDAAGCAVFSHSPGTRIGWALHDARSGQPIDVATGLRPATPAPRPAHSDKPWLLTASGLAFEPAAPTPDMVRLADVAQGLGNLCRFAGQCRAFYSVAQHCLLVGQVVRDLAVAEGVGPAFAARLELYGLLHDAAEAYLVDLPRPVKLAVGEPYKRLERLVDAAIHARFGLQWPPPHAVSVAIEHADVVVLATERRDLMPGIPAGRTWSRTDAVSPLADTIAPMTPHMAAGAWHVAVLDLAHRAGLDPTSW